MADITVLARPLYSMAEAARLLDLPPATLRRWLEGAMRAGVFYEPVARDQPTGSSEVTWGEFVEAGLLREYRLLGISLQRMRPLLEQLRLDFGTPYPLAHFRPLVDPDAKKLLLRAQDVTGVADDLRVLLDLDSGQSMWSAPVEAFLAKVEFDEDGLALRLYPRGTALGVAVDPERAFGVPQIDGIRTEAIAEAFAERQSVHQISDAWGLTPEQVESALQWEMGQRVAA